MPLHYLAGKNSMVRIRVILVVVSLLIVWVLFQLPKVVVESDKGLVTDSTGASSDIVHTEIAAETKRNISDLRTRYEASPEKEKNAIFADSLASWYFKAGKFDSAGWFAEKAALAFDTPESWLKSGDYYYQAFTFALDATKQVDLAGKVQEFYGKVLKNDPGNLDVKTRLAMTYISSSNPMQGITMLREVLAEDPQNKEALFNMGVLSIQSGQYTRAVERFEELIRVDPLHTQGHLLLGVALLNSGNKVRARQQFEKVKQMDTSPAVQAEVDSYLKDL